MNGSFSDDSTAGNDQAGTLRSLMRSRMAARPLTTKPTRVLSVTSGKGGVGKTNVVANLAVALSKSGHRVLVLDGDFGLANLNIVMGLEPKGTIHDVLSGEKELREIILQGPHGVKLIPASSGIFRMTNLSNADKAILLERLENAPVNFDVLLIDTGAGINSDVAYLNSAANDVVVVATPEPTSIADAYALIKIMSQEHKVKRFKMIVNRVTTEREALTVYHNILSVCDRFLNVGLDYMGHIVDDVSVSQSVIQRKVLSEAFPNAPATKCFEILASRMVESFAKPSSITGNVQFFWKTLLSEASL